MQDLKTKSLNGVEYMDEINALQARAVRYWKVAVSQLQRLIKKQSMLSHKETLFANRDSTLTVKDIESWLQVHLLVVYR